jgi:hypothetical protein
MVPDAALAMGKFMADKTIESVRIAMMSVVMVFDAVFCILLSSEIFPIFPYFAYALKSA